MMPVAERPIRVLVADEKRIIREGLSALLGVLPEIEVVGTATDGDDAVQQALALAPDVVLMDLSMPNGDGVALASRFVFRWNRDGQTTLLPLKR